MKHIFLKLRISMAIVLSAALLLVTGLQDTSASTVGIYWTDSDANKIRRADLDGNNVTDLVTGLNYPYGIALDTAGGKMYWTNEVGTIQRADLDGSNMETLVTGLAYPVCIALDTAGGKMYWTLDGFPYDKIQRSDLDGSNMETLVTAPELDNSFRGIALDTYYMYWADQYANTIQKALLDGSYEIPIASALAPYGIALDTAGGKMYWTNNGDGTIRQAALDGSNPTIAVTGLDDPRGIAVDTAGGMIYWTDGDAIQRLDIVGNNVTDLVTGLDNPLMVAVNTVPIPGAVWLLGSGLIGIVGIRRKFKK